jgi:hypothetical protein
MNLGRLRALPALLLLGGSAFAQDIPWTAGDIKYSGYIDGYYNFNFNHPASMNNGPLRYFDIQANQFSLNMAGFYMSVDPQPIGATLQLGYGRGWDIFHGTEPNDGQSIVRFFPQAYVTVAPESWGGFTFDFGKFVTSAAAELTETHLGWNYSRALMYSNGPFYHMGARIAKPVTSNWTVGFQLVNGWNNVEDNNTGKTIGITSALSGEKVQLFNTYYGGPEVTGTNEGWRHYFDTVLSLTPTEDFSAYLTYDIAVDKGDYDGFQNGGRGNNNWWGFGTAAQYKMTPSWAVTGRWEYYNDIDGFISGQPQWMQEFTGTLEYKLTKGFLMRFEYRRDWNELPYFDRGNEPGSSKNVDTLGIGIVAYFGAE